MSVHKTGTSKTVHHTVRFTSARTGPFGLPSGFTLAMPTLVPTPRREAYQGPGARSAGNSCQHTSRQGSAVSAALLCSCQCPVARGAVPTRTRCSMPRPCPAVWDVVYPDNNVLQGPEDQRTPKPTAPKGPRQDLAVCVVASDRVRPPTTASGFPRRNPAARDPAFYGLLHPRGWAREAHPRQGTQKHRAGGLALVSP